MTFQKPLPLYSDEPHICVIFRTPMKSQRKCLESQDNLCNLASKNNKRKKKFAPRTKQGKQI